MAFDPSVTPFLMPFNAAANPSLGIPESVELVVGGGLFPSYSGGGGTYSITTTGNLAALNALSSGGSGLGGFYVITDFGDTSAARVLTSSDGTITFVNPDGIAGNPNLTVTPNQTVQQIQHIVNGGSVQATGSVINWVPSGGIGITIQNNTPTTGETAVTISASGFLPNTTSIVETSTTPGNSFNLGTLQNGLLAISVTGGVATPSTLQPTAGVLLYGNGTAWTPLSIGSTGQYLGVNSGVPEWQTPAVSGVSGVSITATDGSLNVAPGTSTEGNVNITVAAKTASFPLTALAAGGATTNQVLTWNGTAWAPATGSASGVSSLGQGDNSLVFTGTGSGPYTGAVTASLASTIPGARTFSGTVTLNGTTGGYGLVMGPNGILASNNPIDNLQAIQFFNQGQSANLYLSQNWPGNTPNTNALLISDARTSGHGSGNMGLIYDTHFNPITGDALAGSGTDGYVLSYQSAQPNKLQWVAGGGGGGGISSITFNGGSGNSILPFINTTLNPTVTTSGQAVSFALDNRLATGAGQIPITSLSGVFPNGLWTMKYTSGTPTAGNLLMADGTPNIASWNNTLIGDYIFSGENTFSTYVTLNGTPSLLPTDNGSYISNIYGGANSGYLVGAAASIAAGAWGYIPLLNQTLSGIASATQIPIADTAGQFNLSTAINVVSTFPAVFVQPCNVDQLAYWSNANENYAPLRYFTLSEDGVTTGWTLPPAALATTIPTLGSTYQAPDANQTYRVQGGTTIVQFPNSPGLGDQIKFVGVQATQWSVAGNPLLNTMIINGITGITTLTSQLGDGWFTVEFVCVDASGGPNQWVLTNAFGPFEYS